MKLLEFSYWVLDPKIDNLTLCYEFSLATFNLAGCYCQCTKMGSNDNDIPDGLSIVDKYVQITFIAFVKIG